MKLPRALDRGACLLHAARMRRRSAALAIVIALSYTPAADAQGPGALERKVLSELGAFTAWLDEHGARGFVGEIGWPDDARGEAARWNDLAERYYDAADAAGLPVVVWATGMWWPPEYQLDAYYDADYPAADGVDSANTQAGVIEAHPGSDGVLRGVDVATGTFCEPDHAATRSERFHNRMDDLYGTCYAYDSQETFDFLAARGIEAVKIEFRWELVQRDLGGPLWRKGIRRLEAVVGRARDAGLEVVLSMHNFGAYFLFDGEEGVRRTVGSRKLPARYLADVWRRLSNRFGDDPAIAYAIMCEPVNLHGRGDRTPVEVWEDVARKVVEGLRASGDDALVYVAGYQWSALAGWAERHPEPWIDDERVVYEAHHYWDRDASGTYEHSYAEEEAWAASQGY